MNNNLVLISIFIFMQSFIYMKMTVIRLYSVNEGEKPQTKKNPPEIAREEIRLS